MAEDRSRNSGLHQPPVLHHQDAVRQVGDHAHVVGDQDDGCIDSVLQITHQLEDLGLHRDVQRRRRLVGEQQLRIARQRLRDHGALPLAAGELVRVGVDPSFWLRDLHHAEEFDGALPRRLRRHREMAAQHLGYLKSDGVDRVQGGHRLLEDHCDLFAANVTQHARRGIDDLPVAQLDRTRDVGIRQVADPSGTSRWLTCRTRIRRRWRAPHPGRARRTPRSPPGTRFRPPRSRCSGRPPASPARDLPGQRMARRPPPADSRGRGPSRPPRPPIRSPGTRSARRHRIDRGRAPPGQRHRRPPIPGSSPPLPGRPDRRGGRSCGRTPPRAHRANRGRVDRRDSRCAPFCVAARLFWAARMVDAMLHAEQSLRHGCRR